jgi:hypothetical protein
MRAAIRSFHHLLALTVIFKFCVTPLILFAEGGCVGGGEVITPQVQIAVSFYCLVVSPYTIPQGFLHPEVVFLNCWLSTGGRIHKHHFGNLRKVWTEEATPLRVIQWVQELYINILFMFTVTVNLTYCIPSLLEKVRK